MRRPKFPFVCTAAVWLAASGCLATAGSLPAVAGAVVGGAATPGAGVAECTVTGRATAQQAYGSALQLTRAQPPRWSDALLFLREAVAACPTHREAAELLAQALFHTLQFEQCAALAAQLVAERHGGDVATVDLELLRAWGLASARSGDWGTARVALAEVLRRAPADSAARRELDAARPHLGQAAAAAGADTAAGPDESVAPDAPVAPDTAPVLESAAAPDTATGLFQTGVQQLREGRFDVAAHTFQRHVAQAPASAAGWHNLGISHSRRGDRAGAVAAFERAFELDPGQRALGVELARLHLEGGHYTRAEALARRAIAEWEAGDRQLPGMYCVLGKLLEKRDRAYAEAIPWFEKAVHDSTWGAFAARELSRQRALLERRAAQGGG